MIRKWLKIATMYAVVFFTAVITLWAAIAIGSGTCTAFSTSCTYSSMTTGALKIVLAANSSSTLPTIPAGWTSVATKTQGTLAIVIGCSKASSTSDTGTGTWTNAGQVDAIEYSGTAVNSSSDCNTTGIGTIATDGATSTTASCDALTLKNTDNTSWVSCGKGNVTNSAVTPASMTLRVGGTTNWIMIDSNGTVSSWAAHTATIASQAWASISFEILQHAPSTAAPPIWIIQP